MRSQTNPRGWIAPLIACLFVQAAVMEPTHASQSDPGGELGRVRPAVPFDAAHHERGKLRVKFREGLVMRLRGGQPVRVAGGLPLLDPTDFSGTWSRTHSLPESRLEELRQNARAALGSRVVDHNLEYTYRFASGLEHDALIARFHASGWIEYALPAPLPAPLPAVPAPGPPPAAAALPADFEPMQGYLGDAPGGIGANAVRGLPGGTGAGMLVVDLEYSWNNSHQDLANITLLGDTPDNPFNSTDHGTAVLGELVGIDNGWGITGIAPNAWPFFAATSTGDGLEIPEAITTSLDTLQVGDVMLIEQQTQGPSPMEDDFVPVEWDLPVYDAIVTAVGNGVVVVEAGGNGGLNLDDPMFSTGNGDHWPFLAQNDSGAIIVGAGGAPGGNAGDRSRLTFSCYGSTVDLQGWGELVTTTGYGDLWSAEGGNLLFSSVFNGTSSASPIVAGACLLLQAMHLSETGSVLSPADTRAYLRLTGSPQLAGTNPASQNIGPRPDVVTARELALGTWVAFGWGGSEKGTFTEPWSSFSEGLSDVGDGETLYMKPGSTSWTGTVSQPVVLDSWAGSAIIGQL